MASFFYNSTSGQRYSPAKKQIEVDGRIYVNPTTEVLADLGFEEVTVAERPDDRFYVVTGPEDDGTYVSSPRALEDSGTGDNLVKGLRTFYVEAEKAKAGSALSATDWYVVREAETATAIPAAVTTFRAEVRSVCAANEALIAGAADFDAFVALVTAPAQVVEDPSLPLEDWVFIDNPAPHLSSLPEQPSV